MDSIWLAKYKEVIKNGKPIDEAIRIADDHVKVLWNEGEPVDGKPGKGIFARTQGDGAETNQWVYTYWQDHDSVTLADYSKRTVSAEEAENGNWLTLTKKTITDVATSDPSLLSNYNEFEDLIKHPRLINTEQAKRLSDQLKRLSQLGNYENIELDVPEAILVLAKYSPVLANGKKKYTVSKIINQLVNAKKENWTFLKDTPKLLEDSSTAVLVNSDTFNSIDPKNVTGNSYFNASKAKGTLPMRREIRKYINEKMNIEEIFSEITGVQIERTENGYRYSDTEGFLKNRGLEMPLGITPMQLVTDTGLMSVIQKERVRVMLKKGEVKTPPDTQLGRYNTRN